MKLGWLISPTKFMIFVGKTFLNYNYFQIEVNMIVENLISQSFRGTDHPSPNPIS